MDQDDINQQMLNSALMQAQQDGPGSFNIGLGGVGGALGGGYQNAIQGIQPIYQPAQKKPGKLKRLYSDLKGIRQIYRHLLNRERWVSRWLSARYRKEIKKCSSISDTLFIMNDLNKCGRLQAKAYDRLLAKVQDRREFILREQGFVG